MLTDLRQIPLFSTFSDEELACFTTPGVQFFADTGEELFHEGDSPQGLFILLEGELEIAKTIGGQEVILAVVGPGSFVGEISLLTGIPHMATGRVMMPSRLLKFGTSEFEGLQASPVLNLLLKTMVVRLRNTEQSVQQNEKLAALGKLAAGLAHELNNPASASLRAAEELPGQLFTLQELLLKLNRLKLNDAQLDYIFDVQRELVERAAAPQMLNPLAQSDREVALTDWIEARGVEDGWRFAPMLVAASVTESELENITAQIGAASLGYALEWLEGTVTTLDMLRTVKQSSIRIVELIKSVKDYSYMDQSPVQEVDIHEGIEATLKILNHKLKNVSVNREYDPDLPRITVYGSELNQVWTNIIDNAIDAMNGNGQITIRTWQEIDRIVIEIGDNGPGIPLEIQSRIFEPFFTTKQIGKGTGIGLDIAWRIITQKHKGSIRLSSQPGNTRFEINLPLERNDKDRV
jgi:signal transduction histidine kinase